MSRVAADENLHHLFYRDLVSAALEVDPSGMVAAIDRQVRSLRDARRRHPRLHDARAGDRRSRRVRLRVAPRPHPRARVFKHWRIEQLQNLKAAAEQARERADQAHRARRARGEAHGCPARASRAPRPRSDRGSPTVQSSSARLLERVVLELLEAALDDAVVRPRQRRPGDAARAGAAAAPARSSVPRQARASAARRRSGASSRRAGPVQVAVDTRHEQLVRLGLVDTCTVQRSWYGSGAWITSVRHRARRRRPSPSTCELAQPRPPAAGTGRCAPASPRARRAPPRSPTTGRSGTASAPAASVPASGARERPGRGDTVGGGRTGSRRRVRSNMPR